MKILWIPHVAWRVPQRAHLFCRALSQRHEVHVTDWDADFNRISDYVSGRYIRNFTYREHMDGKIKIHGIPRISPALFVPALRRLNGILFSQTVRQIIARYHIDVVVGTFVCPPPDAPRLVFDLFDENLDYWLNYRHRPAYAREIEIAEDAYLAKADAVAAVSSVLVDVALSKRKPPNARNVFLIPNAVDLARHRRASAERVRTSLGLLGLKVIGLISSLGEFTGLLRLVEAYALLADPNAALLVVGDGQQLPGAKQMVQERGLKNVFFTGKVPFDQVQDYFAALDVGTIPFDRTPFTDSACPIKLLEYSAAGKIVVSTALEEIRRMNFPNVVLVEPTPESIALGLANALKMPPAYPSVVENYDLDKLVAKYEAVLSGTLSE